MVFLTNLAIIPDFIWYVCLLALVASCTRQVYFVASRKSAWSITADPLSRKLAVTARLAGAALLLLGVIRSIVPEVDIFDDPARLIYAGDRLSQDVIYIAGLFFAVVPVSSFQLTYEQAKRAKKITGLGLCLSSVILLGLVVTANSISFALGNMSTNEIILSMFGPDNYVERGPYIVAEFSWPVANSHWHTQSQLIPAAVALFLFGALFLVRLCASMFQSKHVCSIKHLVEFAALAVLAYILVVVAFVEVGPRMNPFCGSREVLDALSWTPNLVITTVLATAPAAWMFAFRPGALDLALSPAADPFESLSHPRRLLYFMAGGSLLFSVIVVFGDLVSFVFHLGITLMVSQQILEDFLPRQSNLTGVKKFSSRVFGWNWFLLILAMPPISILLLILPVLLLSCI